MSIHDIQRRNNAHVLYRDLVSWWHEIKTLTWEITFFKNFALNFDEDNIVKVGIDHAISEEIAATDGQLLFK